MILNIITPCSRPENLNLIYQSINIPKENYRWIVVFDFDTLPSEDLIPENCETYLHRNPNSVAGHSQRNFALDLIKEGYIYMNDDDTTIHPNLWENIKNLNEDFITFHQNDKFGNIRLVGEVGISKIDSHNFIVKNDIIGNTRFIVNKYDADGYFAIECFSKSNTKITLNKVLSTYNTLNKIKHT